MKLRVAPSEPQGTAGRIKKTVDKAAEKTKTLMEND